jgi:hypothetical protein
MTPRRLIGRREVTVRYNDDGSKKLKACIRLFSHMVYFYPKHKAMLFADNTYDIYMDRCMYTTEMIPCQPTPCFPSDTVTTEHIYKS